MRREAVQRPSPPSSLVVRPNKAVKSTSSCRRKKRRRGAPSSVSASKEESPTAAAETSGVVVSLPAGGGLQQVFPHLRLPQYSLPGLLQLRPCRLRSLQPGVLRQRLMNWRSV
ncbi:hypothetical protein ILYODFUR_026523 [Ilyodon furcidens]|uniref:Uncharacterized protein n=1 Tax=Ilyodon furcidens TaxID=33524 RepID=A0ABV0UX80_9TELE